MHNFSSEIKRENKVMFYARINRKYALYCSSLYFVVWNRRNIINIYILLHKHNIRILRSNQSKIENGFETKTVN